jgi:putative phosphoserine phosphatase/1-acylglycerol-3-phosphate O-acyltransferase
MVANHPSDADVITRRRAPTRRVGAFFDMDKTLIAENSGALYMKYRYERGEVTGWDLAKGLAAYMQYKVGVLDIRAWTLGMLVQFKGQEEKALTEEARAWFDEMVAETIYPEGERLVREHLAAGHLVAIVSGATGFVVQPLADRLGVEHILYTRLEVEDGRFTGRIIEPICFEEGKIYWLQQLIEEHGIDLAKSYFYTDSVTDLPLLDLVGHPVVTNPDPLLYRAAVRRHWPVRFFEDPASQDQGDCEMPASRDAPADKKKLPSRTRPAGPGSSTADS